MSETEKDRRLKEAERLIEAGRHEEAIGIYSELVQGSPGQDSFIVKLAWAYIDSGQMDKAVELFEGLLEKELHGRVFTGFAFDELVRIYRQQGRYDRLIEICEKAAKVQKDDVSLLTTLGDAYLKADQFQGAIETFRKIVEMEPDSTAVIARLGSALICAGDYDGAEKEFEKAARGDAAGAHTYFGRLGAAFMEVNECGRAEQAFRRAIEIAPEDPMYHCDLGDALICLAEIRGAWAAYEKAVSLRPQSGAGFFNRLGNLLARRQAHSEAVSAFKKAIELDPQNNFYHLYLARSYAALGEDELASAALDKAKSSPGAGS